MPPRLVLMELDLSRSPGRLPRELARQALLAVAREEFGLMIRDAALGEVVPDDIPAEAILDLGPQLYSEAGSSTGTLRVHYKPHTQKYSYAEDERAMTAPFSGDMLPPSFLQRWPAEKSPVGLEATIMGAVDASGVLADFLKEKGVTPRPAPTEESAADVGDLPARLREMSVVAQFEAIRLAHRLPPSAEKQRLLAVGYANLGLLTQQLWSPTSKVFTARGLVYAERAARAQPGAASDEVRAYAAALAGLHAAALEVAETHAANGSPRLQAIIAFCRFRDDELRTLAEKSPEIQQLAAVLGSVLAESDASGAEIAAAYSKVAETAPSALRGYEVAANCGQIGLLHDVTQRGPAVLMQLVPARLREVEDVPDQVRQLLDEEVVNPADLADRLEDQAGTTGGTDEPTWRVLGRIVRDEALVQAYRRLWFLRYPLGLPAGEEYEQYPRIRRRTPICRTCSRPAERQHLTSPQSPNRRQPSSKVETVIHRSLNGGSIPRTSGRGTGRSWCKPEQSCAPETGMQSTARSSSTPTARATNFYNCSKLKPAQEQPT